VPVSDSGDAPLVAAIQTLREELSRAMRLSEDSKLRFELAPIELTLQLVVKREVSGGLSWHIVTAGGKAANETTQTLKLTLDPRLFSEDGSQFDGHVFTDGIDDGL
jgi:hypothetical protein